MRESQRRMGELRTLLPYMKVHRGRLLLAFGLVVAVVAVEMAQPYLVKVAIDRYIAVAQPNAAALVRMATLYLGLALLALVLTYSQELILQFVGLSTVQAVRNDLFTHL
ncbi:MAG TPA: ABC transporter transmembrane domain-containing protein, partial [Geobacteraceae bacterium]